MSLRATLWALDEAPVDNPTALAVLLALADDADETGGSCYPGLRRVAARARVSVNTARSHIAKLEAAGVIDVDRPAKQGRGHRTLYRLRLERVRDLDPSHDEERAERVQFEAGKGPERVKPGLHIPGDPLIPVDPKPLVRSELAPALLEEFEEWWKVYPRNESKKNAKAKYLAARRRGVTRDEMFEGLDRYLRSQKVADGFVQLGQTWLNGEHWNDHPAPAKGAQRFDDVETGRLEL
jgi:DNA-binding transcriptional ArsR family regulator